MKKHWKTIVIVYLAIGAVGAFRQQSNTTFATPQAAQSAFFNTLFLWPLTLFGLNGG